MVVKGHILIRYQDAWKVLKLGCDVGEVEYCVTRSVQLSSKWSDGFKKTLLRALFSLDIDDIGRRIMDVDALFVKIWLWEDFLS